MSKVLTCDICKHTETCRYKDQYRMALNAAKRSVIYDAEIPGEVQPLQIIDLPFVADVDILCRYQKV